MKLFGYQMVKSEQYELLWGRLQSAENAIAKIEGKLDAVSNTADMISSSLLEIAQKNTFSSSNTEVKNPVGKKRGLTPDQVRSIRADDRPYKVIAQQHKLSTSMVGKIKAVPRLVYKDVEDHNDL